MKKILASLLVLALCAPAMAATVAINDNADGTGTIVVTAAGTDNIVGLGLDIDVVSGGNITALSIDGTANPTFNIYPDAAYTLETGTPGSYTYGAGTPIANQTAAGEVGVGNNVAISVGALNGAAIPGATGAASVTINIAVDATTTITVKENALRGGIVLTTGAGEDITNGDPDPTVVEGTITVGTTECMNVDHPDYGIWETRGKPDCWCYRKQCHGDADGLVQFGIFAVYTNDLAVLQSAFAQTTLPAGGACADFAHDTQFGIFAVYTNDLAILQQNFAQTTVAECDGTYINEWLN